MVMEVYIQRSNGSVYVCVCGDVGVHVVGVDSGVM